jgi:hypothetical protein
MRNKKPVLPPPFAALTKDTRYEGTYEVLVPAPDRARPHRVPMQFETQAQAETWIHSEEGKDLIDQLFGRR